MRGFDSSDRGTVVLAAGTVDPLPQPTANARRRNTDGSRRRRWARDIPVAFQGRRPATWSWLLDAFNASAGCEQLGDRRKTR